MCIFISVASTAGAPASTSLQYRAHPPIGRDTRFEAAFRLRLPRAIDYFVSRAGARPTFRHSSWSSSGVAISEAADGIQVPGYLPDPSKAEARTMATGANCIGCK